MNQVIRPGKYSMRELWSLMLTDTKHSQVEGNQGIEETVISVEERKSEINSRRWEAAVVMK